MGIVVLVLLTVTYALSAVFGGLQPSSTERAQTWFPWLAGGRVLSRIHAYQPPARKSVMIDITGMAHPTADNTSMTKRDRSQLYPYLEVKPAPIEESSLTLAPSEPLRQVQIEETALPVPGFAVPKPVLRSEREPSVGRKVQLTLMADHSLSRSAQLTVKATSVKNKVTLRGIVLDKAEKEYIGDKAAKIAGAENVNNRLTVL